MERSGPGIEVKIVLLVAAAVIVQDIVLLVMYRTGATPLAVQIALAGILVLALIAAAIWGNALARAIRRLTRASFVARKGDVHVLTELPRTDELADLNAELNQLIVLLRDSQRTEEELADTRVLTDAVELALPDVTRVSQELLISLKELHEGASAESVILRRVETSLAAARGLLETASAEDDDAGADEGMAGKLRALGALARELELLADGIMNEVTRPDIDETALARAVNGMRDAARTMAEVAVHAAGPLERSRSEAQAAAKSDEHVAAAEEEKADGSRVAELMERSASTGLGAAMRLASTVRRLGVLLETHDQRRRRRQ